MTGNSSKMYVAKTLAGLEPLLVNELINMGFDKVAPLKRGAEFETDYEGMIKANMGSRYAIRILEPFWEDRVRDTDDLYNKIKRMPWQDVLGNDDTFAVNATTKSDAFTHSHFAALRVKDAIVDRFRERSGNRPSIDIEAPNLRIDVMIQGDVLRVSLDSSGDSLHRRGYRPASAKAPLNEILAAAMIELSGWTPEQPLYIPMCGSGTLVMEAAMRAAGLPSQWYRTHYGFMHWRNFDKDRMMKVRKELWDNRTPVVPRIYASDIDRTAVKQTLESLSKVSWQHQVTVKQADFFALEKPAEPGVIILNPPYGERMRPENIEQLYRDIGKKLKESYVGSKVWIISSNYDAYIQLGFRHAAKHTLYNGQLECRYAGFDLYEGSRKTKSITEE